MRKGKQDQQSATITGTELIIDSLFASLALLSIISFGLHALHEGAESAYDLMDLIDPVICFMFAARFFWQLHKAPDTKRFLRWGWIDLLAAIPEIEVLRGLRIIRLVLLIRLLGKTTRGVHRFAVDLKKERSFTMITLAFSVVFTSMIGASFIMLNLEREVEHANIKTAGDALWWSLVTITTVGYGDHYPVTTPGRLVAAWLMVVGIGVMGTVTGVVASWIYGEQVASSRSRDGPAD